jgi:GR25 family glycosyltransferase involved in LPS biosynthesis
MENFPIFISHYKKLVERKQYLDSALKNEGFININWRDEIDRDTMTPEQLNMYKRDDERWKILCNLWNDKSTPRQLSGPEIANAITHINIYKYMIDNNIQAALVLEDDCILHKNFKKSLENIINELPVDFDVCFLGSSFNQTVDNYRFGYFGSQNKNVIIPNRFVYPIKGTHTVDAYILSLNGAKKIYDSIIPFCMPIDYQLNPIFILNDVQSYWCYPPIIDQGSFGIYKSSAERPK